MRLETVILAGLLVVPIDPSVAACPSPDSFSDAEVIAVLLTEELLAPELLVDQIDRDITAIRDAYPEVREITPQAEVTPGFVTLLLEPGAEAEFLAGTHLELNELHRDLELVEVVDSAVPGFVNCCFGQPYNSEALADLHRGVRGVTLASVSAGGGSGWGGNITVQSDGTYLFDLAWECDKGLGCRHHYWVFSFEGTAVRLVEEFGEEVPTREISWGQVKHLFRITGHAADGPFVTPFVPSAAPTLRHRRSRCKVAVLKGAT